MKLFVSNSTQIIASKSEMGVLFDQLKLLSNELVAKLLTVDSLPKRSFAIEMVDEGVWRKLNFSEFERQLHILSQFSYKDGQNSKEVIKLPSVIQLDINHHKDILELVNEINRIKNTLNEINSELKVIYKRESNKMWQSVTNFANILQILRKISFHVDEENKIDYLGLSYLIKPVSTTMTQEKALSYIEAKIESATLNSAPLNKLEALENLRTRISKLGDETKLVLARNGAPRNMLNVRGSDFQVQYMASLPVFVFSTKIIDVNLPSGIKRKPRSDKRIPVGITPSDFGLYFLDSAK